MGTMDEVRKIYNAWLADQRVSASVAKPTTPVPQLQAPKVEKTEVKKEKVIMKKKKTIRRPGEKHIRQVGISENELQKTQALWSGMPTNETPLIRTVSDLFGIDTSYTTTHELDIVKAIIEKSILSTGKSDPRDVIDWIRKQKEKYKISGPKPHRELLLMLKM